MVETKKFVLRNIEMYLINVLSMWGSLGVVRISLVPSLLLASFFFIKALETVILKCGSKVAFNQNWRNHIGPEIRYFLSISERCFNLQEEMPKDLYIFAKSSLLRDTFGPS